MAERAGKDQELVRFRDCPPARATTVGTRRHALQITPIDSLVGHHMARAGVLLTDKNGVDLLVALDAGR